MRHLLIPQFHLTGNGLLVYLRQAQIRRSVTFFHRGAKHIHRRIARIFRVILIFFFFSHILILANLIADVYTKRKGLDIFSKPLEIPNNPSRIPTAG